MEIPVLIAVITQEHLIYSKYVRSLKGKDTSSSLQIIKQLLGKFQNVVQWPLHIMQSKLDYYGVLLYLNQC